MTMNEKTYNDYYNEMLTKTDNRNAIKEAKRVQKIADNLQNSYNVDLWNIISSITDSQYYTETASQAGFESAYLCLIRAKAITYAIETVVLSPDAEITDASEEDAQKILQLCRNLSEDDNLEERIDKIVKLSQDPIFWNGTSLFSVYLMFKAQEATLCFSDYVYPNYSLFANAEEQFADNSEMLRKVENVTNAAGNLIDVMTDSENSLFILHVKKASATLINAVNEAGDALDDNLREKCLYWAQLCVPVAECYKIVIALLDSFQE